MDKQTENNSTSNQNELDFGLEQGDAVAPKKAQSSEPSFLNRLFGKKETPRVNQFAIRKEPTFGTTVSDETSAKIAHNTVNYSAEPSNSTFGTPETSSESYVMQSPHISVQNDAPSQSEIMRSEPIFSKSQENTVEAPQIEQSPESTETNSASTEDSSKFSIKNPENWAVMQKLPQKHRRLFVSIAAAVAVLIALLLLKPNNDTVEDFQAANNGNSMPIEFQSLDPNQPVENSNGLNNDQINEAQTEVQTPVEPATHNEQAIQETAQSAPTQPAVNTANNEQPAPVVEPSSVAVADSNATQQANNADLAKQEQHRAEQAQAEQARAAEQDRIAEQAHQAQLAKEKKEKAEKARAEKAKAEQKAKLAAEKAKAEQKEKAKQAERARAQAALNGAPISEAKPAKDTKSNATKGASKTLVIPASTSLFQVFRNNHLDIRDVNAMTKAKGAGNALSSFNAGDKVQITTNSEGRVSTLRLSNGGLFTRQSDGSYKFSK